MIPDLDESLKQLLIQKGGMSPSVVDLKFDAPTRDRSTIRNRPTINLYLYDVRENVEQREVYWDTQSEGDRHVRITRRPLRMDLSYLVTCLADNVEDEHHLLWQVLETLFRNSPLPNDILQGDLLHLLRPAQTKIAQPDGMLTTPSNLWSVAQSQMPPSINYVVTVELDLNDVRIAPLVFSRTLKLGQPQVSHDGAGHEIHAERLEPNWEAAPVQLGGVVHNGGDDPLVGVAVRLITTTADGAAVQVGASTLTDAAGHYRFPSVPPGNYNLVVEVPGQRPVQQPLCVAVGERGETLPELVQKIEIS